MSIISKYRLVQYVTLSQLFYIVQYLSSFFMVLYSYYIICKYNKSHFGMGSNRIKIRIGIRTGGTRI